MKDFVQSEWFALVSGLASVLGVLLTLYQSRVKYRPHSKIRTLEWQKTLLISLGTGVFIAASIQFYFQQPPPTHGPIRDLHDFLHGTQGSLWNEGNYGYSGVGFESSNYFIELTDLSINRDNTTAYFRITPLHGSGGGNIDNIFPNPIIGTSKGLRYQALNKSFTPISEGVIRSYIEFPSLLNVYGNIALWDDAAKEARHESALISLHHDQRGVGTPMWALLAALGIIMVIVGVIYNPFDSFKKQLLEEGKNLQEEQSEALDKILQGRAYEDLSAREKLKYDQMLKFYEKAQDAIFKSIVGNSRIDSD